MFLSHLHLEHFRNYRSLSLKFSERLTLLQGQNAQGKTNLLEAIYFLATSKSSHARTEREVVGWDADEEPIPFCRIRGVVQRADAEVELEILFTARGDGVNFTKQVRVNGAPRRSMDLIGNLRAVLFLPEDVVLVAGGPSERRRYLDIALCQMDRSYCQHLSRYQKVLTQRNSLLRKLREAGAPARSAEVTAQLKFWDDQLVHHGAYVLTRRYAFLTLLDGLARNVHHDLTAGGETLQLIYVPSFNPGFLEEAEFRALRNGPITGETAKAPAEPVRATDVEAAFRARLAERRDRELQVGGTLYGPHRDDMVFLVNGRDLRTYGSRGQQRTGALALKLAEVQAMTQETGEAPILLLDDVMSELDARRRGALRSALEGVPQAIITTTDWGDFGPELRAAAQLFTVQNGEITRYNSE